MAAIEWLLIGGPADGKKASILYDGNVLWPGSDGKNYEYRGQNYMHRGKMYRIGCFEANDAEPGKVGRLIDETGLRPIDGN